VDEVLFQRGVTWVPDFVANAGGLIQVGGELLGSTPDDVLDRVRGIEDTAREILSRSIEGQVPAGAAALDVVHARLRNARPVGACA
jgi:valine dehydrogenase (NAD+)